LNNDNEPSLIPCFFIAFRFFLAHIDR